MAKSRANSTNKAYKRAWDKFKTWARPKKRRCCPASYRTFSLYLCHVAYTTKSVGMCTRTAAAVRAEHRRRHFASPTDIPAIKDLMKGIANTYGRPPRQVAPLMKNDLTRMLMGLVSAKPTPIQERTAWLALLSFQLAARCGDMKKLQVHHFRFLPDGSMSVNFPYLKNIPVNRGFQVKVSPQGGNWCPVVCTRKYFRHLGLKGADFVLPVVAKRVFANAVQYVVFRRKLASNASLRLHFRDALRSVKIHAEDFGLHSPRRGAATELKEAGFSDAELMSRIGWKSSSMVPLYTSHSKKSHASMSQSLAL